MARARGRRRPDGSRDRGRRVETTEAAVDALREARNAGETTGSPETTEASDRPDSDGEDESGGAVDANDPPGG